jgi:hypothetical protein
MVLSVKIVIFFERENAMEIVINVIVAVMTATISIVTTWYFSNRKKLLISQKTLTIVKQNDDYNQLKITYGNKEVAELKHTSILIKNVGNKTIFKKDLIDNIIRIFVMKNEKIYDHFTSVSRDYINPSDEIIDASSIALSFELLQKNDHICLTILHESKGIPMIVADVNETKILFRDDYSSKKSGYYVLFLYGIFTLAISMMLAVNLPAKIMEQDWIGVIIISILTVIFLFIVIWGIRKYIEDFRTLIREERNFRKGGGV